MRKRWIGRDGNGARLLRTSMVTCVILTTIVAAQVSSRAQTSSQLDELHQRIDEAREQIESVQSQAQNVDEQIASLDEQLAAVARAVEASTALVERTQQEIALLERDIDATQRRYGIANGRAQDIAVAMYKAGPTAAVDAILTAKDLGEISSYVEYSSAVNESQNRVLVSAERLRVELEDAQEDLEGKLAEARELRDEQLSQRQHLAELRAAQQLKLSTLRRQISSERREAEAIAARSAEIERELAAAAAAAAAEAPPVTSAIVPSSVPVGAAGASGFAWPIRGAITSGYGPRWGRMHEGVDIDCVTGNPIAASRAGSVVSVSYDSGGYGNHVIVDHGGGYATLYAHMVSSSVSAGQSVSQGDVVGACGSTGASTGDHLHFEVRVNGAPQDPLAYLP